MQKTITIKGDAGDTNAADLRDLDGIDCQDDFVEYLDEDFADKLESGYMSFSYEKEKNKLYTLTEYTVKEGCELNKEEIKALVDYTRGQWSDGIGENFEQSPVFEEDDGEEVYLSPWHPKQKVVVVIDY